MSNERATYCPYCGSETSPMGGSQSSYCPQCDRHIAPLGDHRAHDYRPPQGIGGWLVLPAIGVVLGPIVGLVAIAQEWALLQDPGMAYLWRRFPGLHGWSVFELVTDIIFLGLSIWLVFAFFGKRSYAPSLIIYIIGARVAVSVLLVIVGGSIIGTEALGELLPLMVGAVITACIWIPYFRTSERVKATFVR